VENTWLFLVGITVFDAGSALSSRRRRSMPRREGDVEQQDVLHLVAALAAQDAALGGFGCVRT